jgi:uncharacterized protein (DUF849 family)
MYLMAEPFIIMSAPNGARRQKRDHPALPITPAELARCAVDVFDAGASILHLHVRDAQNHHSLDVERYRVAIRAIRDAVGSDLVIQATSEAVGQYSRESQMQMVRDLRPQAVSLALRELCPSEGESLEFADFIAWMRKESIHPQYILYTPNDVRRFETYRQKGLFLNDEPFCLLVSGRYGANQEGAVQAASSMQAQTRGITGPWAVCGFGKHEAKSVMFAAKAGGHARVGFENSIHDSHGKLLSGHEQMIVACKKAALQHGRAVATPDDVRKLLEIGREL